MEVDGVGTSTFATTTGPLQIQIPAQVRDNDLLKVTFSGTATSAHQTTARTSTRTVQFARTLFRPG